MVDVVDKTTRSRMMSGIRGKNTRPEMLVRQFLHRHGFRYRLHVKNLPGSPDIVLPKWKMAIFVHGCFWHRHEGCRFSTTPASNVDGWQKKFQENAARDQRNVSDLLATGWRVIILWECGLRAVQRNWDNLDWLPACVMNTGASIFIEWPPVSNARWASA